MACGPITHYGPDRPMLSAVLFSTEKRTALNFKPPVLWVAATEIRVQRKFVKWRSAWIFPIS